MILKGRFISIEVGIGKEKVKDFEKFLKDNNIICRDRTKSADTLYCGYFDEKYEEILRQYFISSHTS